MTGGSFFDRLYLILYRYEPLLMPSDVEFKILDFILNFWEFKTSPVEHPHDKGFLLGYTSVFKEANSPVFISPEAAKADSSVQVRNFIEKELPKHLAVYANCSGTLEVLFSIRQYLGLEAFLKSDVLQKLAYAERYNSKDFKPALISELKSLKYKTSQRCYSKRWATLRNKEIDFLKQAA